MFNRKQLTLVIAQKLMKAVVAAFIAILIVVFISSQIVKIGDTIQKKRTLSYILEKKSETIDNLRQSFNKIGDGDKRVKDALPTADNILDFVAALESLAASTSLQQSTHFGTPVPTAITSGNISVSSIDYGTTLNGNISTLINYLKGHEKLPYFSGISSITLNTASDKGWEGDSSVTIQAKIYTR